MVLVDRELVLLLVTKLQQELPWWVSCASLPPSSVSRNRVVCLGLPVWTVLTFYLTLCGNQSIEKVEVWVMEGSLAGVLCPGGSGQ